MHAWDAAGLTRAEWTRHSLDVRIRLAVAPYLDGTWGYNRRTPRVLWDLPNEMGAAKIVWQPGQVRETNCSTVTTSVVAECHPLVPWSLLDYGDLQVFADRLPATDTPNECVERHGLGVRVDGFQDGHWCLVQGVRRLPSDPRGFSGHAYLVLREGDSVLVFEATSIDGIGPRYRRTTAAELHAQYPAALHITAFHRP